MTPLRGGTRALRQPPEARRQAGEDRRRHPRWFAPHRQIGASRRQRVEALDAFVEQAVFDHARVVVGQGLAGDALSNEDEAALDGRWE